MAATTQRFCLDCDAALPPRTTVRGRYKVRCQPCRATRRKEQRAATGRAWYERNEDLAKARAAAWRAANPERSRAVTAAWHEANPERIREFKRAWDRSHPESKRLHDGLRRARLANAPAIEKIDRAYIYERDGGRCHICGKSALRTAFDLDHLVPLSKGGDHTHANLRVAHRSCNASRGAGRLPAQLLLVA